jgi:hypothetical protein
MTGRYLTAIRLKDLGTRLSERDRLVLGYVSQLRFVSGSQLTRLAFPDSDERTARRALLRLRRLDVLERLPRTVGGNGGGSGASVYRLGLAGQRLAAFTGLLPGPARRRPEMPGTAFVRHALMVSELHALLIDADRADRVELLEREGEPACWRRYRRHSVQQAVLKPDSYLRLGVGDYEDSYFIEVDRGTEGSRAIGVKLREYVAYAASGQEQAEHGVFPKVLWTTPDGRRTEAIAACVEQLGELERELFAVTDFDAVLTTLLPGP